MVRFDESALRWLGLRWEYLRVILISLCPINSWTVLRSTPAMISREANLCLRVCQTVSLVPARSRAGRQIRYQTAWAFLDFSGFIRRGEYPSLSDASLLAGLHPSHLCRKFRREMGVNFWEYIHRVCLQRAVFLLLGSRKIIKEITCEVGYE